MQVSTIAFHYKVLHPLYSANTYTLISVRSWNFKDGVSKEAKILAKNQYTQRKPCILKTQGAPVHQKLGMILANKVFFTKNGLLN